MADACLGLDARQTDERAQSQHCCADPVSLWDFWRQAIDIVVVPSTCLTGKLVQAVDLGRDRLGDSDVCDILYSFMDAVSVSYVDVNYMNTGKS